MLKIAKQKKILGYPITSTITSTTSIGNTATSIRSMTTTKTMTTITKDIITTAAMTSKITIIDDKVDAFLDVSLEKIMSVCLFVHQSVPCYFQTTKTAVFEGGETLNDQQQQQRQR